MDNSQQAAQGRKDQLRRWMKAQEAARDNIGPKKRRGRAPGSMKRFEDGSVGSTDRGILDDAGRSWRRRPQRLA